MTPVEPVRPAAVVDPPKPVKWMAAPSAEPALATGGLWEGSVGPKVMGAGSSGFSPPASATAWSPLVVTSPSVPAAAAAVESQSWVDVGLHGAWPSKQVTALPSPASWDSGAPVSGTDGATHWTGKDGEEWVHVPSPTTDAAGDRPTWCPPAPVYAQQQRQWSDIRTPTPTLAPPEPTRAVGREEFVLEPEGYTVSADPWNLDVYDRDGAGDWSPPDAGWANKALDGWTAPAAVAKPQKTYFNESSDDSNPISSAAPSTGGGGGGSNGAAMQPTIVGAGPELLGAGAGKKSRRRRKKKAAVNESETFSDVITSAPPAAVKNQVVDGDVIAPDAAAGDVIAPDAAAGDVILQPEVAAAPGEATDPEWGFQKAGKKKRSRVRKED